MAEATESTGAGLAEQQMPSDQSPSAQQAVTPQRSSLRQANRNTFKRMLQQKQQEEQEFALFERTVEARLRRGKRPAPSSPPPPPAAAAAAAGEDGVVVVVKRRRGRPPKPRPPQPPKPLLIGPHLDTVLSTVRAAISSGSLKPGTPVWVKVTGYCAWPGLVWSLDLCLRCTWPDVIASYEQGKVLVRFYGDHSSSWVAPKQLMPWDEADASHKSTALSHWGKKNNKLRLVNATLDELAARADDPEEEMCRMDRLGRQYQLDFLQAAARHRHNSLIRPHNTDTNTAAASAAAAAANGAAAEADAMDTDAPAAAAAAGAEGEAEAGTAAVGQALPAAMAAAAAAAADDEPVTGNAWGTCDVCREEVPNMRCGSCHRWLHALCSIPAACTPLEYPADQHWTCPCCGADNTVKVLPEEELLRQAAGQGAVAERMGLTPDWIISTGAFMVFQLPRPTADQPYIAGLLDPACNNKLEPNIPAEVLYDKKDDGLDPKNSWKGYHVLLNPDYRAQVQWRFVNRAIDEVENGNVPAVLLICRNSTDTAYFQRLRPYPRVLLRRCNTQFKDYEKCPIGFGVVVFCIATAAHNNCLHLYERFFKGFSPFGEPNIPIDTEFLSSPSFYQLLSRLRLHAEQHARDHWVQCSKCGVWRIITWQQQQALLRAQTSDDWTCSNLRPPLTSCATPQSKRELMGVSAALQGTQHTAAPAGTTPPALTSPPAPSALPAPSDQGNNSGLEAGSGVSSMQLVSSEILVLPDADEASPEFPADTPAPGSTPDSLEGLEHGSNAASSRGSSTPQPAGEDAMVVDDAAAGCITAANLTLTAEHAEPAPAAAGLRRLGAAEEEHAECSRGAPSAADLLAAFAQEAAKVQAEVAVAYLCKSAAGQLTVLQARDLLSAATAGPDSHEALPLGSSTKGSADPTGGSPSSPAVGAAVPNQLCDQSLHRTMLQQHKQMPYNAGGQQAHLQQQQEQEQQERAADVNDMRQRLLALAAQRQPQQPPLRQLVSASGLTAASAGAAAAAGSSAAVDAEQQTAAGTSLGLSFLAPATMHLVAEWLQQLVQQLVIDAQQQVQQQQVAEDRPPEAGRPAAAVQGPALAATAEVSAADAAQQHMQALVSAAGAAQPHTQGPAVSNTGGAVGSQLPGLGDLISQQHNNSTRSQSQSQLQPQPSSGVQQACNECTEAGDAAAADSTLPVLPPACGRVDAVRQQSERCNKAHSCSPGVPALESTVLRPEQPVKEQLAAEIVSPAAAAFVGSPGRQQVLPSSTAAAAAAAAAAETPVRHAIMQGQPVVTACAAGQPLHTSANLQLTQLPMAGMQQQTTLPGCQPQLQHITMPGGGCWPLLCLVPRQGTGSQGSAHQGAPISGVTATAVQAAGARGTSHAAAAAGAGSPGTVLAAVGSASGTVLNPMLVQTQQQLQLQGQLGNLTAAQQHQLLLLQLLAQSRSRSAPQLVFGGHMPAARLPVGMQNSSAYCSTQQADPAFLAAQPIAAAAATPVQQPATGNQNSKGDCSMIPAHTAALSSEGAAPTGAKAVGMGQAATAPGEVPAEAGRSVAVLPGSLTSAECATAQVAGMSSSGNTTAPTSGDSSAPKGPSPAAPSRAGSDGSSGCAVQQPNSAGAVSTVNQSRSSSQAEGVPSHRPPPDAAAAGQKGPLTAEADKPVPESAINVGVDAGAPAPPSDSGTETLPATPAAAPVGQVAPSLRPRAVWGLTRDPLVKAVLLEQPCLMEALLALLGRMASLLQQPLPLKAGAGCLSAAAGGAGNLAPAVHTLVGDTNRNPAAAVDAGVDADTLQQLCSQPVLTGGGRWPQHQVQEMQVQEVAEGGCEDEEDDDVLQEVCGAAPDSTLEEAEMMSALELARAARVAANKAFMLGLGLGQSGSATLQQPGVQPLEPNSAAVIAAARQLAQQAAVQRAKRQLDASQRLLDARRRARRLQERRLRATLEALTADEAAAAQQVADARRTLEDVREEAYGS